eukprot:13339636-Alexandrium_andersonii.AAC.1
MSARNRLGSTRVATERPAHAANLPHTVGAEAAPNTRTLKMVVAAIDDRHRERILVRAMGTWWNASETS